MMIRGRCRWRPGYRHARARAHPAHWCEPVARSQPAVL